MHRLSIFISTVSIIFFLAIPQVWANPTEKPEELSPKKSTIKYTVAANDTLSKIASRFNVTLDHLVNINNLADPNLIHIGQVLLINVDQNHLNSNTVSRGDGPNSLSVQIIGHAKKYIGASYSYSATGPNSFDCSGFTMFVFNKFSINLPHSSSAQAQKGTKVSRNELLPGDLVFFNTSGKGISHVGIFIGANKFIHASTSRGVIISSLGENYYNSRYVTARRII